MLQQPQQKPEMTDSQPSQIPVVTGIPVEVDVEPQLINFQTLQDVHTEPTAPKKVVKNKVVMEKVDQTDNIPASQQQQLKYQKL